MILSRLGPAPGTVIAGPKKRSIGLSVDGPLLFAGAASAAFYLWFVIQGHSLLIGRDPLALVAVG